MSITLNAKNKIVFVTEALKKPKDDDPLLCAWIRCNDMDLHTWKMIGMARQQAGLYFLLECFQQEANTVGSSLSASTFQNNYIVTPFNLWHYRLGHLSFPKLLALNKSVSDIKISDAQPCTICPLAKQHRLLFPLSNCVSCSF